MQSYVTCRMTNRLGDRCTAEALDPNGEAVICARHAAEVMRTIDRARDSLRPSRAGAKAPASRRT
ncbi:hypothetical protein MBT84_19850 [Streptomyces sp. MBT84]|uniref:hypothetical protein n=1 Tax=Streptomyces sp. MBT84 TaxID=1488414 RepID=UPI001C6F1828|nr:hypothetical protein [Streptomyces sp. MBT84]MBW8701864.1 hypothetical protein [Streptomyces sp. MBT84]